MDHNLNIKSIQQKRSQDILKIPQGVSTGRFYTEMKKKQPSVQAQNSKNNQHRLKLKDYLRLTSISKRSNSNVSRNKQKQESPQLGSHSTPIVHKTQSMLDTQKSLIILKHELKSDLNICLQKMNELINKVDKDSVRMEKDQQQYQQLVFLCQLHRIVKQNVMANLDKANNVITQHRQSQLFKFSALARDLIGSQIKKSSTPSRKRSLHATSRPRGQGKSNVIEKSPQ